MRWLLAMMFLVGSAWAAPPPPRSARQSRDDVQLLRYYNDYGPRAYKWNYELSDGTKHDQEGNFKNENQENESLYVQGSYAWVQDGVTYKVRYTADEEGYRPVVEQGPGGPVPYEVACTLLGGGCG